MTNPEGPFTAYAVGLVYASACTSLSLAEATRRMNAEHPTGIESRWTVASEDFASGDQNGRPCDQRPDTHRHLLFSC